LIIIRQDRIIIVFLSLEKKHGIGYKKKTSIFTINKKSFATNYKVPPS
jgi:hypothetical protein